MAKITLYGIAPSHSLIYGLNHKNIDKIITIKNWKTKAIVRDSKYIYIQKGKQLIKNKKYNYIYTVFINENADKKNFNKIEKAISYANNYHKTEGNYPKEWSTGWKISPIMKFPKANKSE
tara:strand:+ start:332 stop:691 length:360 start_codon:yes stop_codon:yes gene_type:complete